MRVAVEKNRALSPDCMIMEAQWPEEFADPLPGQFVMAKCRTSTDPLWRRPFGVHDFRRRRKNGAGTIALLYQVVGPTTADMCQLQRGDTVDLVGPLGNGFSTEGEEHWLVAGGRGIAPLYYFAKVLRALDKEVNVFIGGCGARHILKVRELEKIGVDPLVATEDGSRGTKGLVTGILDRRLRRLSLRRRRRIVISGCGPEAMLREIGKISAIRETDDQLSLDTVMACGQGYCQGCTVHTGDGYRLCCKDGPVFSSEALLWRNP